MQFSPPKQIYNRGSKKFIRTKLFGHKQFYGTHAICSHSSKHGVKDFLFMFTGVCEEPMHSLSRHYAAQRGITSVSTMCICKCICIYI